MRIACFADCLLRLRADATVDSFRLVSMVSVRAVSAMGGGTGVIGGCVDPASPLTGYSIEMGSAMMPGGGHLKLFDTFHVESALAQSLHVALWAVRMRLKSIRR